MRHLSLLLTACLATALDVPPPSDPEGLGERLAMLEYLRARGVKARSGLSDNAVRELYSDAWQADPANGARLAVLLRNDANRKRIGNLRSAISKQFGIDPGADLGEEELKALLVKLEGEKREKAADAVRELAARGEMRLQQVRFNDGGMLLGVYDASTNRIEVHEESGRRVGEVQLNPALIASVVDVVIRIAPPAPAAAGQGASGCDGTWSTDPEQARTAAIAERRPMLVLFTGSDWCGWCIKLDKEVFSTPEFRQWAAKRVVLLKLDFPRKRQLPAGEAQANEAMSKRYAVKGFPSVVFTKADGAELGRSGYMEGGPAAWIAAAEKSLPSR
jgi:protein disulfide-isomerase